jgi:hypothetical protein
MKIRKIDIRNQETAIQILDAVEKLQALADEKVNLRDVACIAARAFECTIPAFNDGNPGDYSWTCLSEWFMHVGLGGDLPSDVHLRALNQSLWDLPEAVVLYLMKRDGIGWDEASIVVALMSPFELSSE